MYSRQIVGQTCHVKTYKISREKIFPNHKSVNTQQSSRKSLKYSNFLLPSVPEKVWTLQNVEKINPDVFDLSKKRNDEDSWWNQALLTHLDLSSNVLTEISSNIRNLMDLTVLNVSQ